MHSVFISAFACCAPCCVYDVTIQVGGYQRQEPEADLSACSNDMVSNTLRYAFLNEPVLETIVPFVWGCVPQIKADFRDVTLKTESRTV